MARSRNIKPALFKNEILGEADPLITLLFIGLWTLADREGRLEDRPKRIKVEILPWRDCDVDALLTWLHEHGFIIRYKARINRDRSIHFSDGDEGSEIIENQYIQVVNFHAHQNPHKNENQSIIPAITNGCVRTDKIGTSSEKIGTAPADSLSSDSLNPKSTRKRKTSIPKDFVISDGVRKWAKKNGHTNLDAHYESFKLKATAKNYQYANWDAAFMVAIRDDWAKLGTAAQKYDEGAI